MECRKCGKNIDEFEVYCDDCKQLLKKEKELDKLIDENKNLNKLEITKEVETLNNFKNEKKESINTLKEELRDIVNIEEEEMLEKNNKLGIIIIIISIVISISIIFVAIFIFFFNLEKEPEPIPEVINYEKIINKYGDSVNLAVSEYLKEKEEIPSWSIISDLITYKEHEVICRIHNIYKDGNIYLNDCKVDGKKIQYSYGIEQEEKEGKKINIYKSDDNYLNFNNEEKGTMVGTITCKTETCDYIEAYEKYVLIKEENKYYIYDYENGSMEFGPFNVINNNYENNMLAYENILYGILYEESGVQNIYNLNKEKTLKDIDGNILTSSINFNPSLMYKYGYAIFENDDKNNFVNLNTGNVSYSIIGALNSFIEDTNKKLVYITTHNFLNSKITIYNSNGKTLFSGKEFNDMRLLNNNIIVSNDTNYYIYDSNLKLKLTSKDYNNVLGLFDDFIVVVDNEYLEIVDLEDNILVTYDLKWDSDMYKFDNILSGKSMENDEELIYLIIERSDKSLKYYYNTVTKEFGLK